MNQYDVQLLCRSIEGHFLDIYRTYQAHFGHLWDIVAAVLEFKVKTPMFKTPNKRLGNDQNTCRGIGLMIGAKAALKSQKRWKREVVYR